MKTFEYGAQSYRWATYTVILPEEAVEAFLAGKGHRCDLQAAKEGNNTLVRACGGETFFLRQFNVTGVAEIVRGEGKLFLASGGSWSGGSILKGAVALKPGAILRYGAKGCWGYLVADESGIRTEPHDPRLFEEGSQRWQPLE